MRKGLSGLWLALVLIAFGIPLFIGLGSFDLDNDEAIYSYAVDSILKTGDWLAPRSSPNPNVVFLEKPHLKFWIVALPIHLGLLPLNEFGLRFWDALFGALSFAYVFLIGKRLGGWACGVVAGLVLFAHEPLIFDHGFRSNNMDAALVLAYCGGVYHYLRWASAPAGVSRTGEVAAVLAWFYLGFMSKFVAAIFLPAVLGLTGLAIPSHRARLIEDWRRWAMGTAIAIAAMLPWFVYQHLRHGPRFWEILLSEHVVTRFTSYVDPAHVQPWHFYVTEAYLQFTRSGSAIWVILGLALLLGSVVRRQTGDGLAVLLWAIMPLTAISFGSSKLYHYLYPFLPPLALAAGYAVATISTVVSRFIPGMRPATGETQRSESDVPRPGRIRTYAGWGLVLVSTAVLVATIITGTLHVYVGDQLLFRNSSVVRPAFVALGGLALIDPRTAIGCLLAVMLSRVVPAPISAYKRNLDRLDVDRRPLATIAECVRRIDERRALDGFVPGAYGPVSDGFVHQYYFYFRGTGWGTTADDEGLRDALFVPGKERVVLIESSAYAEFLERTGEAGPLPSPVVHKKVLVLLPGTYDQCWLRSPS